MDMNNEWESRVRAEWDCWDNGRFGHLEGTIQIIEELLSKERADWLRSEIEKLDEKMIQIKKEILQSGGGGIDTEHWYYKGILFSIPGIKQILSYGAKNESWWTLYLLKHNIFMPLKLKQEGKIEALTTIITRLKEELLELDRNGV